MCGVIFSLKRTIFFKVFNFILWHEKKDQTNENGRENWDWFGREQIVVIL